MHGQPGHRASIIADDLGGAPRPTALLEGGGHAPCTDKLPQHMDCMLCLCMTVAVVAPPALHTDDIQS